ncbi:MAG: sigma-70 family RNA polymerase sigma factor [Acidimicrobiales bacterium]
MTSKGNAQNDPRVKQVRTWLAYWVKTANADFEDMVSVAEEKCIRVIEGGALEGTDNPTGYLIRVVRNQARDWWRIRSNRPLDTTFEPPDWPFGGPGPEGVAIEHAEVREILEIAQCCLSPADVELITRCYYTDEPLSSIARRLGMEQNTVKMRATRKLAVVRIEVLRRRAGIGEISSHASVMLGFVDHPPALLSDATRRQYLTSKAMEALSRIGDEHWHLIGATIAAGGLGRGPQLDIDELAAYQTFCCLLAEEYLQLGFTLVQQPGGKIRTARGGIPAPLPELLRPSHFGLADCADVRRATVRALLLHMRDDTHRHAAVSALQRHVGSDPDLQIGPVQNDGSPLDDLARLVRREAIR